MVLVMVHGSIHPIFLGNQWRLNPLGYSSQPDMSINIIYDHEKEEKREMICMDWNSEQEYDNDTTFYNCFQG